MRTLGSYTAEAGDRAGAGRLAPSTVSDVLNGRRLPGLPRAEFVAAFVTACLRAGSYPREAVDCAVARWIRARDRLVESHPSTGGGAAPPCTLPSGPATLVGRATEIAAIVGYLRAPATGARTVVVTGPAGGGKTVVAMRAAHLVRGDFPDGQVTVDLGGLGEDPLEPAAALAVLQSAIGWPDLAGIDSHRDRIRYYRAWTARRRILLVLDDAGPGAPVDELMPAGAGCATVVTSRTIMAGVEGLRVGLGPLSPPAQRELLTSMIGERRVRDEPDAVDELVRRCGGLALAMWVVGARLAARPHWTLASVADALADDRSRLRELGVGAVSVRDRIRVSYESLSAAARRALRALARSPAAVLTPFAAAAVLDVPTADAQRLLDELFEVHLVNVVPSSGGPAYVLDELVGSFARTCVGD